MRTNRKHNQRGFTLLELVVVIVIIGILAAVAIPKFVSLSTEARAGVVKGVGGSLASANVGIYAAAAAQNQTGATGSISACGQTVSLVYGYAGDIDQLRKCITLSPTTDFTGSGNIAHTGATTAASCQVSYTAATSGAAPTYTTTVTDCS